MNIAVKFYETMLSDDANIIAGISPKIPATVIFNKDTAPDDTYSIMTDEQYHVYLISIEPELSVWKTIQEQAVQQVTEE